jgi:hypothetical protein
MMEAFNDAVSFLQVFQTSSWYVSADGVRNQDEVGKVRVAR